MDNTNPVVPVLGGTGPQGKGLAFRLAKSGHEVILGSLSADRASDAAEELRSKLNGEGNLRGESNEKAAHFGDVDILAIPFDGHDELVSELEAHLHGKVVVSCVNPLSFDKVGPYGLDVHAGSAAQSAASSLPDATVVGALHTCPRTPCSTTTSTSATKTCSCTATSPRPKRWSWYPSKESLAVAASQSSGRA